VLPETLPRRVTGAVARACACISSFGAPSAPALALAVAPLVCASCTTPARRDDPRFAVDVGSGVDAGSGSDRDPAPAERPPTQLALGQDTTCWLAGQRAWCLGRNESGVLGDGTLEDRRRPGPVALSNIARLSAGALHACAIDTRANLHCSGLNEHGSAGPRSGALTRACLQPRNITHEPRCVTRPEPRTPRPQVVPGLDHVTAVATGLAFTCAVASASAAVRCFGYNVNAELGDPNWSPELPFAATSVPLPGPAEEVAAGFHHACARLASGAVHCWGSNAHGEAGVADFHGRVAPPRAVALTAADQLVAGADFSCVRSGGNVRCWGNNATWQLGVPTPDASPTPLRVGGVERATQLATGALHACALVAGGVVCWGNNMHGQLGRGTRSLREAPAPVAGLPADIVEIAAGGTHSCARASDHTLWCWGENKHGQLGDGTTQSRSHPVQLAP
jgi:alpha-tubulin suppressor-like RCC1 family protein